VPQFNNGGDGFITNEEWLIDGQLTQYWVEAGLINGNVNTGNGNNTTEFWADSHPNGGGFHAHYGPILSSGDFGHDMPVYIQQLSGGISYSTSVRGASHRYDGLSTNNPISPFYITVGQEIYGSSGASEQPYVQLKSNQWEDTQNHWHQQDHIPFGPLNVPPSHGYWKDVPAPGNGGGDFLVCVIGAGC
jgi:hypothetical protein